MDLNSTKVEALYKSIDDTQQTIRFLDTKVGVSVVVIGIYAAMIGSGISDFSKYFWNMGVDLQIVFSVVLLLFVLALLLAIILSVLIVYPESNPSEHIQGSVSPTGFFYVSGETDAADIVKVKSDDLKAKINSITDFQKIIEELSFELLKLAYIRDKKLQKVRTVKKCIIGLSLLAPCLMALHLVGESHFMPEEKGLTAHCTCAGPSKANNPIKEPSVGKTGKSKSDRSNQR